MYTNNEDVRKRLQDNLSTIRKLAGWTMDEFGEKIGVTKQTISNLEKGWDKSKMTQTQYIAIRAVLQYEINCGEMEENRKNLLANALDILVDNPKEADDDKNKISIVATTLDSSKNNALPIAVIVAALGIGNLIRPLGVGAAEAAEAAAGGIIAGAGINTGIKWMQNFMKKDNKKV